MRIYVDGVLDGSVSSSSAPASGTSSLKIGRNSLGYYFNGLIDEVRVVYTSNFTPSMHLTASSSTKGLWKFDSQSPNDASGNGNNGSVQGGFTEGLWKFDGSSANDSSGNGNNGTLYGGATYSTDVSSGDGGGGGGSGSSTAQIHWLVTDQLGTPRMVFDQTGSLENISRHDYFPFGEEIFAGAGGRTPQQGYGANDNVRQRFTSKERDNETGLDYFLAVLLVDARSLHRRGPDLDWGFRCRRCSRRSPDCLAGSKKSGARFFTAWVHRFRTPSKFSPEIRQQRRRRVPLLRPGV